jgi:hypothetical protein
MDMFVAAAEPLTKKGFKDVIEDLHVGIPELLAVLSVESRHCGFLPDRRPVILFERHVFHRLTHGNFSQAHPEVSHPHAGGYAGGAKEYARLESAMMMDRPAALMSTSWGAGQIMGFNHSLAGFDDVESMVIAMQASEDAQLVAVASFLKKKNLHLLLNKKDWPAFAKSYNGSSYSKNKYDLRLAGAFQQYAAGVLPDIDVRRAQLYLTYLGFDTGGVDGIHGKRSRSAVGRFREENGLGDGDRVDGVTLETLRERVRAL